MASWEEPPLPRSFDSVFYGAAGTPTGATDDEFNRTSFLSHFDGANNGVNNAFDDGSASNHTINAQGNVTQGSFGPFARPDGEFAVHFDGEGFYNCAADADFAFGTGDFCMEAWVFVEADDYNYSRIFNFGPYYNNNDSNGLTVDHTDNAHKIRYYDYRNNFFLTSSAATPRNTWFHVAVTKSSNTVRLFINGTAEDSGTNNNAPEASGTNTVSIGNAPDAGTDQEDFQGFISNARVVKGSAVYTSNFTPSTSKLTAITNTKLLTCQSNRFVDNSAEAHAITIGGAAGTIQVSAFGPFLTSRAYDPAVNGASMECDGSGDYLSLAYDADFNFGTGSFTIEAFVYPKDLSGGQGIYSTSGGEGSQPKFLIYLDGATLKAHVNGFGSSVFFNATVSPRIGEWTHIAFVRNGSTWYWFINGTQSGTGSNSTNITFSNLTTSVGYGGESAANTINGFISGFRVVKGTAVYTSNFTPPTAPVTAITNTKLLLNMADGQAIDSAAQNNLTLVGTAKTSTAQKKFGSASILFDGNSDYAYTTVSAPIGSGDYTVECFVYFNTLKYSGVYQFDDAILQGTPFRGPVIFIGTSSPFKWGTMTQSGGDQSIYSSSGPSANQWYHVANVRTNGVVKIFVDGTQIINDFNDTTNYLARNKLVLGGFYDSNYYLDGYIDDFRVSQFARYTSNFTAPTAAFADKGQ